MIASSRFVALKCKTKNESVVITAIEDDTPKFTAPVITLTIIPRLNSSWHRDRYTISVQRLRVVLIPK
jgi:hypothetical protein